MKVNKRIMVFLIIVVVFISAIYGILKVANNQIVAQYKMLSQKYELKLDGNKSMGLLKDPYVKGQYKGKPLFIGSSSQVGFYMAHVDRVEVKIFKIETNSLDNLSGWLSLDLLKSLASAR